MCGVGGLPGPEPSADQMVSWALIPRGFTLLPWKGRRRSSEGGGSEREAMGMSSWWQSHGRSLGGGATTGEYRPARGFPGGSAVKESTCNTGATGDVGSIPGLGRSLGGRAWQPTPIFLPGDSHGQRSLAGRSPWGRKEANMTEAM